MRSYLTDALKSDTAAFVKEMLPEIKTLRIDSDKERKQVFTLMHHVTKEYLHNGRNIDAIRLLNDALPILEDESDRDTLETRALINMYVCIGAAYEQAGMPGVGLDYYMKGLKVAADTA